MSKQGTDLAMMASLGGKTAAEMMTDEERRIRASKAAQARWDSHVLQATHGSPDKPLVINGVRIPVYVLENKQRVIVQAGMVEALGMVKGGSSHKGGTRIAKFVSQERLKPFAGNNLIPRTQQAIKFRTPAGTMAFGFDAEILADICETVIEADKNDALTAKQRHIAQRCWILYRGFARVGIVALIDEATGFQDDRARDALAKILEAFVAKELRKWVSTFPSDFYKEMFRLRKLPYTGQVKRPAYIGTITNDVVYKRLAPGVLEELKRKNPVLETGHRKVKHHQWLTEHVGYQKLLQHLSAVIALMQVSDDWQSFIKMLNKAKPKQIDMPLFEKHMGITDSSSDLLLPSEQSGYDDEEIIS